MDSIDESSVAAMEIARRLNELALLHAALADRMGTASVPPHQPVPIVQVRTYPLRGKA